MGWLTTGKKNAAAAKLFAVTWSSMNGNADILKGLLASKFFWAVNLGGLADTSFSITGSFDAMMAKRLAEYPYVGAVPQKNGMYGVIDSVAIDPESHGKTILASGHWALASASGAWTSVSQTVPPPIRGSEDVFEIFIKFDFDEEGKINSVVWSVDSGVLHKLRSLSPVSTQFSAWWDPTATSLGAFSAAAFFFFVLGGFFGNFSSYKF